MLLGELLQRQTDRHTHTRPHIPCSSSKFSLLLLLLVLFYFSLYVCVCIFCSFVFLSLSLSLSVVPDAQPPFYSFVRSGGRILSPLLRVPFLSCSSCLRSELVCCGVCCGTKEATQNRLMNGVLKELSSALTRGEWASETAVRNAHTAQTSVFTCTFVWGRRRSVCCVFVGSPDFVSPNVWWARCGVGGGNLL